MRWTIAILTLTDRTDYLYRLLNDLSGQAALYNDIEIIYLGDNKKRPTGEKRQLLLDMAQGEYISFIDDDDRIADNYIDQIYKNLDGVDVVNFKVKYCNTQTEICKEVHYSRDYASDKSWKGMYLRLPNHLMAVKTEHARAAGYESKYIYEDREYAIRLKRHLKTQTLIDKVLYHYDYNPHVSETPKHIPK